MYVRHALEYRNNYSMSYWCFEILNILHDKFMGAILEMTLTFYNLDICPDYYRLLFNTILSPYVSNSIKFGTKHAMFHG